MIGSVVYKGYHGSYIAMPWLARLSSAVRRFTPCCGDVLQVRQDGFQACIWTVGHVSVGVQVFMMCISVMWSMVEVFVIVHRGNMWRFYPRDLAR